MTRKLSIVAGLLAFGVGGWLLGEMIVWEEQSTGVKDPPKFNCFGGNCGGSPCQDAQFIGAGINWSGVGRELGTSQTLFPSSRWGTLISSSFYLTANHHAPVVNNTPGATAGLSSSALPISGPGVRTIDEFGG
jgi:hypothetical protein